MAMHPIPGWLTASWRFAMAPVITPVSSSNACSHRTGCRYAAHAWRTASGHCIPPPDLARHVLIHDETIDGEGRQPGWREWLTAAGVSGVDSERGPRFNNAVLAVEAALDGQGVALALRPLVEADLLPGG